MKMLFKGFFVPFLVFTGFILRSEDFTWRDWNATPTPDEGKRVENYYPFAEYFFTEWKFHRIEFDIPRKVNDAWLIFYTYMNEPANHRILINGKLNWFHPKKNGPVPAGKLVKVKASGIKKGKNTLALESGWCALKLIINLKDGEQKIISSSPGWQHVIGKNSQWRKNGYSGKTVEAAYRLGSEGYHLFNNPFTSHEYAGLIDFAFLRNKPVYKTGDAYRLNVSIPSPFYGKEKPELNFTLKNCFATDSAVSGKGKLKEIKNGRAFYTLSAKLSKPGAFDLEVSFGKGNAMKRKTEVVVAGKIKQPIAPDTAELLNLLNPELIDNIDCVNPGTPPRIAGTPGKVVRDKGISYYETGKSTGFLAGPGKVDYAMWKLNPKELNSWHLLEVDIPENKNRAQIIAIVHNNSNREYGVESTVETGSPRPLSNKIYTHRMLFIPKQKDVRVIIAPSPRKTETPAGAAVKAIRFYKVAPVLPQIKLGNSGRANANYNERSNLIGVSHYPGSDNFGKTQFCSPHQYRRWYLAIEKQIEYSGFVGQNAVCHGMYQYVKEEYPSEKEQTDYIKLMLEMYEANGIKFYCNNEYFTSAALEGKSVSHKVKSMRVSDEEVAAGKDTYRLVSYDGKQAKGFQYNNPCHPEVKKDFLGKVEKFARKYGEYSAFRGMMVFAGTMGCAMNFRGPEWGYGDTTYNLFKNNECPDAPEFSGEKRFRQRYEWIKRNVWNKWLNFRCREVYKLNRQMISVINTYSPDARLIVNICAWPWNGNIGKGSLPELKKKLIEGGTDVRFFGSNPKMLLMHNDWMGQHIKENELEFVEKYNRNKKIWDYVTQEKPCAVFFWTGFYEMRLFLPEDMLNPYWAAKNWLIVNSEKRFIGSAGKSARDYLSAFSNAFAYADPIFFSNRFTDVAEHRGFLIQRAEAGQTMSYIPKGIYRTMKGSNKNIVLKRRGNNAYIVNNTPESPEVKLMATGSEPFIFNSINNINLGIDKHSILKIKMKPYQILPLSLRNVNSMKILKN